jgi:hypothetical protein
VPIKVGVKKGFVECFNINWLSFGHEAGGCEQLTNNALKKLFQRKYWLKDTCISIKRWFLQAKSIKK